MSKKANNKSTTSESKANAADPAAEGDGHPSADMTADEMAMFNKIMGEIEGPDQTSEKGKPAEAAQNAQSSDSPSEAQHDEGLDEEQQKAFESIMAQIDGGNKSGGDVAPEENAADPDLVADDDDFTAELEKVAKEAEASTRGNSADSDAQKADDGLDEDQRKALESIMAQIKGGDKSGGDVAPEENAADPASVADDDDFAAELEKVAKEAEAAARGNTADSDAQKADDGLDEDQRKAFESIMAEIEGGSAQENATDGKGQPPVKPVIDEASTLQTTPETDNASGDVGSNEASDDIEEILKEITSNLDASDDEDTGALTDMEAGEVSDREDDIIVDTKSGGQPREIPSPETAEPVRESPPDPLPRAEIRTAESQTAQKPVGETQPSTAGRVAPLPKLKKTPRIGRRTAISVSVLFVLVLSVAGYYLRKPAVVSDPAPPPAPMVEDVQQQAPAKIAEAPQPIPATDDASDQQRLTTTGAEIDQLRTELIAKQKEIEELRDYYQSGIDAEIQNVVATIQETRSGTVTLKTAMADPLVGLGLDAIQRRESYIKKLKNPATALHLNSEELFYLSRKAGLLAMMAKRTSDIDVDGFVNQAHIIMNAHRNALAQLNIDDVEVPASNLDAIWQRIDAQLSKTAPPARPARSTSTTDNEAIWAAVCSGNFSQKHKMTALSPEAARCLAGWKGKDLFLNELTLLTPEAARQLAGWEGEWLGLNGLTDLSPETAAHLAHWKGRGMSLNGLTRLSPRVVAILSEWPGDQIELIHVKHMAHWENPKTRLFLSEEMDRKINGKRP